MRRFLRVALVVAGATALVALGWWAGREAMAPPEDPLADRQPVTFVVAEETVGRSLNFAAGGEWRLADLARNGASGVVTSIAVENGSEVDTGDLLYAVNLRPAVIASGTTPSFRDMTIGFRGADVAQLQALLSHLGFYAADADGVFDAGVRNAVREWQDSLGIPVDGVVRRGDVVFVDTLPVRVVVDPTVTVGTELVGGEMILRRVLGEVDFTVTLASGQANLVPLDAEVRVRYGDTEWPGRIVSAADSPLTGELILTLEGSAGGPVCGDDCVEAVPLGERTLFPVEIVVIPEMTGPGIPVAAVLSRPDGSTFVRLADGSEVAVSVRAASDGIAIVDGVDVGAEILLPTTSS